MCMFCAAIPATAAVAAKLNHDQQVKTAKSDEASQQKPIKAVAGGVIVLLVIGSVIYHTQFNSLL